MKLTDAEISRALEAARLVVLIPAEVLASLDEESRDAVLCAMVLGYFADQLADAQRTATQAVGRVRELEGEREEMLTLLRDGEMEDKCGRIMWGGVASECPADDRCGEHRRRAIVERLTASAGKETDRG